MYIHTFEVSNILTSEDYFTIQDELKSKSNNWDGHHKNKMSYYGLKDQGIIILFTRTKKKKFTTYNIKYRISAHRVLNNDCYTGLFNTKDYDLLEDKVNSILMEQSELLPKLEDCSLQRLDYCINARLENQKQVKEYIKLCQRCNIPRKLKRLRYQNESKKKYNDNDMTVYSSKYIEISIYNKYAQMKEQQSKKVSFPDIEDAKNIVRIEIRCMKDKLKQIDETFEGYRLKDQLWKFMKYGDEIGTYLYEYYLSMMFGTGKLYTLSEVKNRIECSGFTEKQRKKMLSLAEDANISRSLDEAVSYHTEEHGKAYVKKVLDLFDLIDTSPVTITKEMAKQFDGEYIPSPLELFYEFKNGGNRS